MKMNARLFILCIPVIGLMMITGCNKPQNASVGLESGATVAKELSDSEVTMKVKTALILDEKIKGFDITVVTLKGDVKLTGVVDNQSQIDHVINLASSIEGVHSVHNELSVKK